MATEAIFTPSRKAENKRDFRIFGRKTLFPEQMKDKINDGRKTAIVASIAPGAPFICQPIKVTDENTGPGVNCPTANPDNAKLYRLKGFFCQRENGC